MFKSFAMLLFSVRLTGFESTKLTQKVEKFSLAGDEVRLEDYKKSIL